MQHSAAGVGLAVDGRARPASWLGSGWGPGLGGCLSTPPACCSLRVSRTTTSPLVIEHFQITMMSFIFLTTACARSHQRTIRLAAACFPALDCPTRPTNARRPHRTRPPDATSPASRPHTSSAAVSSSSPAPTHATTHPRKSPARRLKLDPRAITAPITPHRPTRSSNSNPQPMSRTSPPQHAI